MYFKKKLEEADRNASIETIEVKFCFSTSADAVWIMEKQEDLTTNPLSGYNQDSVTEYNFFEHRVESLSLERMAALAKALETALQLRGMTEYAADTSDIQPHIFVNSWMLFHSGNIVESSVTYHAANSNYQKTRSW